MVGDDDERIVVRVLRVVVCVGLMCRCVISSLPKSPNKFSVLSNFEMSCIVPLS
jgi:hypothetical protein